MDEAQLLLRLGDAIRRRRVALGISQETFADSIRMHRAQYSKVERGERNVTVLTLRRVAVGLGTTSARLLSSAKL